MVGKKVGIQATGVILLRALLAKNKIAEKDVTIVTIGADMAPLLTGQVDAVTGWLTNTTALKVLGAERVDLALWDTGVQLYALPYYATTKTLADAAATCSQASCAPPPRAGHWADANRDQAVDMLVKEYPNLNRADERVGRRRDARLQLRRPAKAQGWGSDGPGRTGRSRSRCTAQLGQFTARTPKVDDVITLDILKATQAAR